MARATHADEWTGVGVSVRDIERQLGQLRGSTYEATEGPDLRTSVMTHMAWVPEDWVEPALETLAGLAERHPSRTIILVPDPDGEDGLDAEVSVQCFAVPGQRQNVCSEVIQLRLGGRSVKAPASIVEPLLVADLPVFLRWRGEPAFGEPAFEQLVDVVDRLVVDSGEWRGLPGGYRALAPYFDRTAVSDIAWSRTSACRVALAAMWPGIARVSQLRVRGPAADAFLLCGWLRSRLGRDVELACEDVEEIESVEVDGAPVALPQPEPRTSSDLLSDELDRFSRDPVYEEAVRAT